MVANIDDAKGLPVKMWFTNAQQKQLWDSMETHLGKTESGNQVEAASKSNEEKNMNLRCFLRLSNVHWQDYLVDALEHHEKSHKKILGAEWLQRGELHTRHGFVEAEESIMKGMYLEKKMYTTTCCTRRCR